MASRKRALLIAGVVVGVLAAALIALAVVLLSYVRPALRQRVVDSAREQGFELSFDDLELSPLQATIHGARVRLIGVSCIETNARRIEMSLSGFSPETIHLVDFSVQVTGSLPKVMFELGEWTKNFPAAYDLPISAENVRVTVRSEPTATPWLEVKRAVLTKTESGGLLTSESTRVAGIELGKVGSGFTKDQSFVALSFGSPDLEQAPLTLKVLHDQQKALVELKPTALERLAAPFGVPLPVQGVTLSGTAELKFPKLVPGSAVVPLGPVNGTLKLTLDGYVPPHPVELDGFVFGSKTEFESKLVINAARDQVALTDSVVSAGAFKLHGAGVVDRQPDHLRIRFDLKGNLPCGALAGAALESRLGKTLGKPLGGLAERALLGSVAVMVKIEADSRALDQARVLRTIGVGCGLKPIAEVDFGGWFSELPLPGLGPGLLPGLPSSLPQLPSSLPALPSGLPGLPPLPSALRLPGMRFAPDASAPASDKVSE